MMRRTEGETWDPEHLGARRTHPYLLADSEGEGSWWTEGLLDVCRPLAAPVHDRYHFGTPRPIFRPRPDLGLSPGHPCVRSIGGRIMVSVGPPDAHPAPHGGAPFGAPGAIPPGPPLPARMGATMDDSQCGIPPLVSPPLSWILDIHRGGPGRDEALRRASRWIASRWRPRDHRLREALRERAEELEEEPVDRTELKRRLAAEGLLLALAAADVPRRVRLGSSAYVRAGEEIYRLPVTELTLPEALPHLRAQAIRAAEAALLDDPYRPPTGGEDPREPEAPENFDELAELLEDGDLRDDLERQRRLHGMRKLIERLRELARLQPREEEAVDATFLGGLSAKDWADEIDIEPATARGYRHRALKKLRAAANAEEARIN